MLLHLCSDYGIILPVPAEGICGALAQLVARNVRIVEVRGSNPLRSTTVRLKTNVFRRFFYVNDQNRARSDPKSRKKEGAPPQNSAIFLILGIAVLR